MRHGADRNSLQDRLLNPDRGLFQHKFFWFMAIGPVALGLALGLPVWIEYSLDVSSAGYNKFLEISKLPLGVMAMGIPFGAVVAGFHRAVQTAKQIKVAESNNIFRNYSDHKKEFIQDCIGHLYKGDVELKVCAAKAYELFFSNAKYGGLGCVYSYKLHRLDSIFQKISIEHGSYFHELTFGLDMNMDIEEEGGYEKYDVYNIIKNNFIKLVSHRVDFINDIIDDFELLNKELFFHRYFRKKKDIIFVKF